MLSYFWLLFLGAIREFISLSGISLYALIIVAGGFLAVVWSDYRQSKKKDIRQSIRKAFPIKFEKGWIVMFGVLVCIAASFIMAAYRIHAELKGKVAINDVRKASARVEFNDLAKKGQQYCGKVHNGGSESDFKKYDEWKKNASIFLEQNVGSADKVAFLTATFDSQNQRRDRGWEWCHLQLQYFTSLASKFD